ncbi:cell wall hydrolase [Novosphingobium sp. MMS21-SN21R]|uniref:cell wall hydrolase n=1 Tax=Novosphingobium sp. MMS21-SN21R TaxID=2969298 RepID=UPI0028853371|nr:cell wall hydrolase [Novosphingobium sp. MMS21-SN21R]MDT0508400.1 cell wall hydrolase [Novosphingobium sp. MMS21-SN21R]
MASLPVPANASPAASAQISAVTRFSAQSDERECLATAIAYEAGYEPVDGRRAVADVILNRTRSGRHPATICGVVYEGSARRTGCQFTFTCDGSLRRRLPDRVVDEARRIADEALAGISPSQIGGAINYHADYVSPYWAPSMLRVAKIGRHIFYRPARGTLSAPLRYDVPARTAALDQARPTAFAPWGISLAKPD